MAGTLTVTGLSDGLLSGGKTIGPLNLIGTATVGQITDVTLASGDNTLAVPAGAVAVLLVVSSANAATLTVRTNANSSDAGLPVAKAGPMLLGLASGVTSLIVNASASGGLVEATFI